VEVLLIKAEKGRFAVNLR